MGSSATSSSECSLVGGYLFKTLGVSLGGGLAANLIVATVGAVVLILFLRVLKRA